ncbi:MAG TPA: hypothetical protein VFW11_17915, partial [Cyclobacteriaceae bacterium]|nr:hypothetical protein [Cyclobacteriaceae bacterium]
GLYFMYALFFIAVVAAIVLPLMHAVKSPGAFLKSLYGIIGLVVIFIVAYAISSNAVKPSWAVSGIGESASKLIGAGLIVLYITILIAIIGLIYSEISKAFK